MVVAAFPLTHHKGACPLCGGFGLAPPLDRDDVVHRLVLGRHLARGDDRRVAEVRELDGCHHAKFAGIRDYEAFGRMAHRDALDLCLLDIGRREALLGGNAVRAPKAAVEVVAV